MDRDARLLLQERQAKVEPGRGQPVHEFVQFALDRGGVLPEGMVQDDREVHLLARDGAFPEPRPVELVKGFIEGEFYRALGGAIGKVPGLGDPEVRDRPARHEAARAVHQLDRGPLLAVATPELVLQELNLGIR